MQALPKDYEEDCHFEAKIWSESLKAMCFDIVE